MEKSKIRSTYQRSANNITKSEDIRCCCGKLQAKMGEHGIIIKCSRCKQKMVIEFSSMD